MATLRCIAGKRSIPKPAPRDDAAASPITVLAGMVLFKAAAQHAKTPTAT
jgi:hypothetical protein